MKTLLNLTVLNYFSKFLEVQKDLRKLERKFLWKSSWKKVFEKRKNQKIFQEVKELVFVN